MSLTAFSFDRRVFGNDLDQECPGNWPHTPPYGNWGVDSSTSYIWDSDQWSGWRVKEDDHHEWNTCTSNSTYAPPNCAYLNDNDCTTQAADPDNWGLYAYPVLGIYTPDCDQWDDQVFTLYNEYLDLYELDPWSSDEFVDTLHYDPVDVTLDNDHPAQVIGETDSENETGWYNRVSGAIHVRITGVDQEIECN
jgi:hypothetical protein